MLGNSPVTTTVAVKDLAAAKTFYTDVLGLSVVNENPMGVFLKSGDSQLLIYESQFAGTNKATYAGWKVDDIQSIVTELKGKGVQFQTFDLPGATWDNDVAVMGSMKSAWFTDPDGNILALDNSDM